MRPVDIVIPTLDFEQAYDTSQLALISCFHEDVEVQIVLDQERSGFTKTANRGLAASRENSDVCLLNDDIYRFQPGWLNILQRWLYSRDTIGIVGPSGRSGSTPRVGQPGDRGEEVIEMLPFWCVLIKRDVINRAGLLDERFIHYSSDTWYCRQVRHLGFDIVWLKSVFLWHRHQGSGLKKDWRVHDRKVLVELGKKNGVRYSPEVPGI